MTFTIPSGVFTKYYDVVDELLTNGFTSNECTVVYPPLIVPGTNPQNPTGLPDAFPHGGFAPGINSSSDIVEEVTDTLRLRIYWRQRDWIKVAGVVVADAEVMVIGFSSDLIKMKQATEIRLINGNNHGLYRMKLAGQPFLHGFGKDRYFIAFLKTT